jgi:hypothetical protein
MKPAQATHSARHGARALSKRAYRVGPGGRVASKSFVFVAAAVAAIEANASVALIILETFFAGGNRRLRGIDAYRKSLRNRSP